MLHVELLHTFLLIFLFLSFGILVASVISAFRQGLTCLSAFSVMWVFAYAVPTLLYLVSPDTVAEVEGYAWIGPEQWALAALVSLAGFVFFGIGYAVGKLQDHPATDPAPGVSMARSTSWQLVFLLLALALQFYPLYVMLSRGIAVNFVRRAVHWQEVGLAIRLAYFALPSTAVAYWLFLEKRSLTRLVLLAITLSISIASAVSLGARMFLVLLPLVMLLIHSNHKPKTRGLLFVLSFALVLALSVGYYSLLRSENPRSVYSSLQKVMVSDVGRMHTLAYASEHAGLVRSDLVTPPVLGSYFYWLILPIPRSAWPDKPYATNLQFSFWFRHEHTSFYVPDDPAEMTGSTEFGFVDEALLNLGFSGLVLLALLGYLAARLDSHIRHRRYLRVVVPIFFLLGTIYSFNGILNYLAPFLIFGLVLDWLYGRRARQAHRLMEGHLPGEATG